VLQLRPNSRVFLKQNPELEWGIDTRLLRSIEFYQQVIAWQQTRDGQSNNPKNTPKPVLAPWEKESVKDVSKPKYLTNAELGMDLKEFFSGNFVAVSNTKIGEVSVNNKITTSEEQ
jgi:hypothetical protein